MDAVVRKDLGELSDMGAVAALAAVDGLLVVDAGCGNGANSRALAERGATVLGVEPDPVQAEKNRAADPVAGVSFAETGAEALPLADASADGVFFFRSLHHVPRQHMDDALAEAARVLKPGAGFLCVVEPDTAGSHFPVIRPFNDETEVRGLAQAALARTARRLFAAEDAYAFVQHPRYASFEAMVAWFTGQTFNQISRAAIEQADVRETFEAGRGADGDYVFEQPMLLNFFRGARQRDEAER